ncbi:hypothetical protein BMETH_1772_0 [methanotrophic bacterial endosymbiont of Bathymodiolus sp.]|nr:hypothetical protein BMETH_1772_0 [methanotrophic bacterial endosymbiont of Bathymodiolus sp.]
MGFKPCFFLTVNSCKAIKKLVEVVQYLKGNLWMTMKTEAINSPLTRKYVVH